MRQNVNRQPFVALRGALKPVVRPALRLLRGLRVENAGRLPDGRRPGIVICNHAAWVDSVYIIAALRARLTICGARPGYFATPLRRWLLAAGNVLRVEDHDQFLADCLELLRQGHTLLIYPEMGRNPDGMGGFAPWAAEVAIGSGTPAVPAYLYGTTRGHRGGVRLIVGEPIPPEGDAASLTRRFHEAVSALASGAPTGAEGPQP